LKIGEAIDVVMPNC